MFGIRTYVCIPPRKERNISVIPHCKVLVHFSSIELINRLFSSNILSLALSIHGDILLVQVLLYQTPVYQRHKWRAIVFAVSPYTHHLISPRMSTDFVCCFSIQSKSIEHNFFHFVRMLYLKRSISYEILDAFRTLQSILELQKICLRHLRLINHLFHEF